MTSWTALWEVMSFLVPGKGISMHSNTCGYCRGEIANGECEYCNGFGGPKGLSKYEDEARCGYCGGTLFNAVPDPDRSGYYKAISTKCGCDGFGN